MDESAPFKDRSAGLVVFGVLTILLGAVCALFVPFMFLGAALAPKENGMAGVSPIFAVLLYGMLAIAFIWLGIGSIQRQRWARALLLIISWVWLITGLVGIPILAIAMPQILASAPNHEQVSAAMRAGITAFMLLFQGFILIVLPLCWVLFYRSRHVKATCEARHPNVSWTDLCPLPVLALSLLFAIGAPMLLILPFSNRGVMPFFGILLTGLPGGAVYWLLAIGWGYAAWTIYRLEARGWWFALAMLVFWGVSGFLTYWTHDILEIYRTMGMPEAQLVAIKAVPILGGHYVAWMTLLSSVLTIGFVLFTGRYFKARHATH